MPDTNTTSQAADMTTNERPAVEVQVTSAPQGQMQTDDEDFDKERAMATIRKQREWEKEAKARLKRLEELEAEEQKRKDAALSETDKLKKEVAKLQAERDSALQEHRKARIEAAILLAAKDARMFNPQDARLLADLSEVTLQEDGSVTGADEAIKKLVKDRPYLAEREATEDTAQVPQTVRQAIPASPRARDERDLTSAEKERARMDKAAQVRNWF